MKTTESDMKLNHLGPEGLLLVRLRRDVSEIVYIAIRDSLGDAVLYRVSSDSKLRQREAEDLPNSTNKKLALLGEY